MLNEYETFSEDNKLFRSKNANDTWSTLNIAVRRKSVTAYLLYCYYENRADLI